MTPIEQLLDNAKNLDACGAQKRHFAAKSLKDAEDFIKIARQVEEQAEGFRQAAKILQSQGQQ